MNLRKLFAIALCAITLGGSTLVAAQTTSNLDETAESYFTVKNAAYATSAVVVAAILFNYLVNRKVGGIIGTGHKDLQYYYLNRI
jgi:hypothetical protein